jgi:predicted nucleic acid-binding protein
MRFVLDASITITWAMRDEDHPLAELAFQHVQSDSAIVPGIWWYEIRNILLVKERQRRISPRDSEQFILDLTHLSIDIDFPQSNSNVIDLSRRFKLSVYDSAYQALAMHERLPPATLDMALESAAIAAGVPLLD